MVICPSCKTDFSELDALCRKCKGEKFVDVLQWKGPKGKQVQVSKKTICPRCNGAGTEQANRNRNNRQRGASNEYKAVDTFKEWWLKPDGTQYDWKKTPQSGGMALAAAFDMAGDICTTAPDWPFSVECKRTESCSWDVLMRQLLTRQEVYGDLADYIRQAVSDTPTHRVTALWLQRPGPSQQAYMVIIHRSNRRIIDYINTDGILYGLFKVDGVHYRSYVMSLDTFLAITPDAWRTAMSRWNEVNAI